VQENAVALQYAAAELQADKDFVLAAVKQNGVAVEYAAEASVMGMPPEDVNLQNLEEM
jgi:hypothetical protein